MMMADIKDFNLESRPWFKSWPDHLAKDTEFPNKPAWWILERNIDRFPDRDAIIFVNHENQVEYGRLTYKELWKKANSFAANLRKLGIRKGDRVAVLLPNSPAIIISYYGIWMAGAVAAPYNVMAKEKELRYHLQDTGSSLLIAANESAKLTGKIAAEFGIELVLASVGDGQRPEDFSGSFIDFTQLVAGDKQRPTDFAIDTAEDTAVLLYTGGTTGDPKGAMLTHRNIVANTIQFGEWYDFSPGTEICVCSIPMTHSGGMSGVMNVPLYAGATLIVVKRFKSASILQCISHYKATRFFGVPTMYIALLNDENVQKHDLSSLKACRTNAAPLPVAVKQAFDCLVGKEVLVEGYGLTETSPLTHANPIKRPVAGSIGIPLRGTDAKIISTETGEDLSVNEEGELVIRGPQVMKGYLNKPEATAEAMKNGWFHTGDVARMDENGYFYIVDRLKDMINSGGYKVWPREVEEVLYACPKVNMALVIGVNDDYLGETVKAFIVPREDCCNDISCEEIIAFCKNRMANYKTPRLVEFRDSLPISPQGKVLRRVLRDEIKKCIPEE
jgi:long-chain acyl-CoA synthetase